MKKLLCSLCVVLAPCLVLAEDAAEVAPATAEAKVDTVAADQVPTPEIDHTDVGLETFALESGEGAYLGQRFQHTLVLVRLPNGKLATTCVAQHPHNVDHQRLQRTTEVAPVRVEADK